MKLIRIDISNIAYTEKKVPMDSFLDLIEGCEKLLFETGVYKNGPTTIETCLSAFGNPGEALFKVYIPTNIPIEGNDEFQYLEHFTIKQCVSDVTLFDEHFLPKIEEMKQYIQDEGLEMQGDTVFLAILPIFGQHFVEINIPIKEISDAI